jgi:hypothetical protein
MLIVPGLIVAVAAGLIALVVALTGGGPRPIPPMPGLSVKGRQLVDGVGRPLQIAGVNRSGTEYYCVQGRGVFDGPSDDASIEAMQSWGINAVRVPLNEDCWLGLGGLKQAYSGLNYQRAIRAYVNRLLAHKLDVILDLHWVAPGTQRSVGLRPAPDADHAPAFWASVAAQYRGVRGVAFDLFNEPHGISWSCWRNGCLTRQGWRAAGMQQLIDAVRHAGARQPVVVEGLDWGSNLSGWSAHRPVDPAKQLVAGWHAYDNSLCSQTACWRGTVAPVARTFPVLATEIGETDCRGTFVNRLARFLAPRGIGYLAWSWNPYGCSTGPSLISDYSGTPTPYGAAVLSHIDPAAAARIRSRARFDFSSGTDGWNVRWGSTLTLSTATGFRPGGHGLSLELTGGGWPAAGSEHGLVAVGAGSRVSYHLWAPSEVAAGLSPMLTTSDWRVTLLPSRRLHPGWNMITFRVPPTVRDVRVLGLQVDNPRGWRGRLVLDHVVWSPVS